MNWEAGTTVEQVCQKCDGTAFKVLAMVTDLGTLETRAVECVECGEQVPFKRTRDLS